MPLDQATRALAIHLERELQRMLERERARAHRGEEVRYDSVSRMATWETRRGDVIGRWYGDVIARYVVRDRLLRWAWAGRSSIFTMTHAEVVAREGQSRGVPQLAMSVVGDLDEDDARMLVRLAVIVAQGEGVELRRAEEEITFIGIFDAPRPREGEARDPSRYSILPPPPVRRSSPPPVRRSSPPSRAGSNPPARPSVSPPLPPIREIYEPRDARSKTPVPERKIREPARGLFLPVASAVLEVFAKVVPGCQQALFVLTVDRALPASEARRLVVLLAANDACGALCAVEPSQEVVDAAARLVEADQNDGNGPWRRLSVRITPKPDGGAMLHVDVI